ncbi:hypothetical protein [Luteolibacter luteus]|uniref:Uncharacterized protein n=1 Tax=Luteolibacter luteus TaxID=2728835 RepID=A0A858RCC3_9BACT|nr:hypothetical protein [Luteolibacter luteus]QJE94248.1 hypothetical protein HHL09_00095 [Luteolibacter luteus]
MSKGIDEGLEKLKDALLAGKPGLSDEDFHAAVEQCMAENDPGFTPDRLFACVKERLGIE